MTATLTIQAPGRASEQIVLGEALVLGRSSGCDICLPFSGVSKRHARIAPSVDGWRVFDLQSTNGTLVNGRRVSVRELEDGDVVELGPARLRFASDTALARSAVTIVPDEGASVSLSLPGAAVQAFPPAGQVRDPEVLARDYDVLRAAHALSRRLGEARELRTMLEVLLRFCFDELPADTGAGLLLRGDQLHPVASRSRDGGEVQISSGVLQAVIDSREALLIEDVTGALPIDRGASIDQLGLRSVLAVPLLSGEQLRGVVVLDNRSRVGAFTAKELQLLNGLAAQLSVSLERAELLARVEREAALRARLGRFLAPEIVASVQRGQTDLVRGGRFAEVAVLFCDLRGFTALSGGLGPGGTVALLNDYFEAAVAQVFRFGGMVDKFVGDELMAVWGLPEPQPDAPARALRCALALQQALGELSASRQAAGEPGFAAGIGVDAGRVVAGLVGARARLQYTVIGPAVNLASRLCGRAGPGETVARAGLVEELGGRWRVEALEVAPIKGFQTPPALCRVLGEGV